MNHHLHKPNLQEPVNNEDGACPIPTLITGLTSVNPNPKTAPKYGESIGNLINKLRDLMSVIYIFVDNIPCGFNLVI